MAKDVTLHIIQPDPNGPQFGEVYDPADFGRIQQYWRETLEAVLRECLVAGGPTVQVAGFPCVVAGLTATVYPGVAIDANGLVFDSLPSAPVNLVLATAHPSLPRVDVIYARLESGVPSAVEFRPFVRLRTQAEKAANVPPYPPTQFNVPTERHWRVALGVRAGEPSPRPVPPAVAANEVALWEVSVSANATQAGAVRDVRPQLVSVSELAQRTQNLLATVEHFGESVFASLLQQLAAGTGISLTVVERGQNTDGPDTLVVAGKPVTNTEAGLMTPSQARKLGAGDSVPAPGALLKGSKDGTTAWGNLTADDVLAGLGYVPVKRNGDTLTGNYQINGKLRVLRDGYAVASDQQADESPLLHLSGQSHTSATNANRAVAEQTGIIEANLHGNPGITLLTLRHGGPNVFEGDIDPPSTGNAPTPGDNPPPNQLPTGYLAKLNTIYGTKAVWIRGNGYAEFGYNVHVAGILSKAAGTFLIDHPMPERNKTHQLRHGFIEGPRYDLLYRGRTRFRKQTWVEIDLDHEFEMTPGTFANLTQDAQGFAWNETGWTQVRVSAVRGAKVMLQAQLPCSDMIGWCIFGERADDAVQRSYTTDGRGKLIVEPERDIGGLNQV